ncbi:DinB family protein [Kurthia senegalensis]|uniref:DinB family protein n=1 Tax=Kurthia senegalensis TaxID=1033740 RepID=UPI0009FD7AC9|nr:DinB family protein [Kurthia senegalensis]
MKIVKSSGRDFCGNSTSEISIFSRLHKKTPHHLLFHAFTHEFHHKGQLTAMLHLMGHTPNNINMVQFDSVPNED